MASSNAAFDDRLAQLKGELVEQGRAVQRLMESAIDALFAKDQARAALAGVQDKEIDRVDIRIEREAVGVLFDAMDQGVKMDHYALRMILTIVKVNNEFERIADYGVSIAGQIGAFAAAPAVLPPKFRMMANSVIGIMQATNRAFARMDTAAAQQVLASDDATEAFKRAILHDTEERLARGEFSVDHAFALHTVAANLGRMADHCTNVAEQVIYVESGKIVRHMNDRWTQPEAVD